MGSDLGSVYNRLVNELNWLYVKWHQFRELYASRPGRLDLLNEAAPLFFRIVQDTFWDDTLLHVARLVDPVESRGKPNLTIRALPDLAPVQLRSKLEPLVAEAGTASAFAVDWRKRRLAHYDLDLALGRSVKPLSAATKAQTEKALAAIAKVLNCVDLHFFDSTMLYDAGQMPGDVTELLYPLRDGVEGARARRERFMAGKPLPDDLRPPREV